MNILQLPLTELHPYKNNPRKNEKAVDAVAASIKQYGFLVPLVISKEYEIITGHTRYLAAKKLGLASVPCVIADELHRSRSKPSDWWIIRSASWRIGIWTCFRWNWRI